MDGSPGGLRNCLRHKPSAQSIPGNADDRPGNVPGRPSDPPGTDGPLRTPANLDRATATASHSPLPGDRTAARDRRNVSHASLAPLILAG